MYASWCVLSASLYPPSFPIASPVFPITLVILLPVEIVSKRHFWKSGINQQSGGVILWSYVCCDLEVSNCPTFLQI